MKNRLPPVLIVYISFKYHIILRPTISNLDEKQILKACNCKKNHLNHIDTHNILMCKNQAYYLRASSYIVSSIAYYFQFFVERHTLQLQWKENSTFKKTTCRNIGKTQKKMRPFLATTENEAGIFIFFHHIYNLYSCSQTY